MVNTSNSAYPAINRAFRLKVLNSDYTMTIADAAAALDLSQ